MRGILRSITFWLSISVLCAPSFGKGRATDCDSPLRSLFSAPENGRSLVDQIRDWNRLPNARRSRIKDEVSPLIAAALSGGGRRLRARIPFYPRVTPDGSLSLTVSVSDVGGAMADERDIGLLIRPDGSVSIDMVSIFGAYQQVLASQEVDRVSAAPSGQESLGALRRLLSCPIGTIRVNRANGRTTFAVAAQDRRSTSTVTCSGEWHGGTHYLTGFRFTPDYVFCPSQPVGGLSRRDQVDAVSTRPHH